MEPVVYEESPLAEYLRDGGDEPQLDWAPGATTPDTESSAGRSSPSPPSSPSPFAPTGRPLVKARFRNKVPGPLHLDVAKPVSLRSIRKKYSAVVAASIDRADNAKFLEQFRYTIIASQLLSGHSGLGQHQLSADVGVAPVSEEDQSLVSTEGIIASVLAALAVAVILSWVVENGVTRKRLVFLVLLGAASILLGQVHMRRQWLRYRRSQSLSEITKFIENSHSHDSASGAALSLIQEVELVSRGYRIAPLPPISRIEDRTQTRKCVRLRRALKNSLSGVLKTYNQMCTVVNGFAEQTDLEKYYDIYDISDFDMSDAQRGFDIDEFEDVESLRTLKILAARFYTLRKMFLCALLALDASGDANDLLRWTTAVESLRSVNATTNSTYDRLQTILSEEETFPLSPNPKNALTPGRERWQARLRKLNSLSTGIRGLQAKLQLLREESDRTLNDSNDISELGPNLMSQFESIGVDLKDLMAAWEEGRAALALGIDRNEKRLSSISTLISPASSLSGLTTVDESGTAVDALKALTGESPPNSEYNGSVDHEAPEVFEAVARPRPRSMLTREERIVRMKEDREHKAFARQQIDATKGMLRELETVINLRPRTRMSAPAGRIVSM
ncbi:Mysoin-binding motif of peroxisomes-domain-containing protein [Ilyonectria robusta]|uniref:Mysoin-binding motif of peroxisomes-domain-containing protein n=1 Tax=Ilyonectria robusta TaxID=1079257 RepID=UPI001E8CBCE2|nr:Mysoin-binding motif of peroxisomes-domain-containing protein [Ilyonectria robusta]KAH8737007.1 Mysoin-binding motif of peroxisomes-domain-containing protein [Ilyonectria robusta]